MDKIFREGLKKAIKVFRSKIELDMTIEVLQQYGYNVNYS